MDYKDYDDGELFMLVCEDDENAKEILFNKYKPIIDTIVKKYMYSATLLNIEFKDLWGEAMVGFTDALNNYDANKETSLSTFIYKCVNSRLTKAIVHAKTKRNKFNNDTYSLDHIYKDFGVSLEEMISDDNKNDPLTNMVDEEKTNELIKDIRDSLSNFESQVFDLLINNFNYMEIANILDKEPKQIDNTIQRIKGKVKSILNNNKNT